MRVSYPYVRTLISWVSLALLRAQTLGMPEILKWSADNGSAWSQWRELLLWLMNAGGYRGEDIGYVVGIEQQTDTLETPFDLTSDIQLSPASYPAICRCVLPSGQPETPTRVPSKLEFPGWACVTRMVGILHGR